MTFMLGKTGQVCIVVIYVASLYGAAMAKPFEETDQVFEDISGGVSEISPENFRNYPELLDGIKQAEGKMNQLVFIRESLQATVQVVQGELFRVEVDAAPCSSDCEAVKHCSFNIWYRSWEAEQFIIDPFTCSDI